MIRKTLAFPALLAACLSGELAAHGLWTESRRGHLEAIYGHGAEDDAYDPKKIVGAWAYDRAGGMIPVTVERREDHARFVPLREAATLLVALDNGYWTQDADGRWLPKGERDVPKAKASGHYSKYSLAILQEGAALPAPDRLRLALLPQQDPLQLKAGDTLTLQVLVDGQPAQDVELIGDYVNDPDQVVARTDAQGRASVPVRNNGLNVIAASVEIPLADDPDARVRGYFGSLSFVATEHSH